MRENKSLLDWLSNAEYESISLFPFHRVRLNLLGPPGKAVSRSTISWIGNRAAPCNKGLLLGINDSCRAIAKNIGWGRNKDSYCAPRCITLWAAVNRIQNS